MILRRDPLCKIAILCDGATPSTEVDHIIPLARGGDNSPENLQGACRRCHSHKTATEDSGFARSPVVSGI
jgi:5-methylcytosine-specific restriction enzyme A